MFSEKFFWKNDIKKTMKIVVGPSDFSSIFSHRKLVLHKTLGFLVGPSDFSMDSHHKGKKKCISLDTVKKSLEPMRNPSVFLSNFLSRRFGYNPLWLQPKNVYGRTLWKFGYDPTTITLVLWSKYFLRYILVTKSLESTTNPTDLWFNFFLDCLPQ